MLEVHMALVFGSTVQLQVFKDMIRGFKMKQFHLC